MNLSHANKLLWQKNMHKLEYFVESDIFHTKLTIFRNLLVVPVAKLKEIILQIGRKLVCLSMTYT